MRYVDCLIMNAGLMAVETTGMRARFSYAVSRNKQRLELVIKSLDEMATPNEEHKKFIDEREELLKEYSKKDEDGNPVIHQTPGPMGQMKKGFLIPNVTDKSSDFNVQLEKLQKKHKKTIDEQAEKEKKYQEYLENEADDFEPIMVDWKLVPDGLSQQAMDGVFFMIKPEEAKKPAIKKRPAK